jgi:hypothetical protein
MLKIHWFNSEIECPLRRLRNKIPAAAFFSHEAVTRRSKRRLSRIAKGP